MARSRGRIDVDYLRWALPNGFMGGCRKEEYKGQGKFEVAVFDFMNSTNERLRKLENPINPTTISDKIALKISQIEDEIKMQSILGFDNSVEELKQKIETLKEILSEINVNGNG